MKRNTFERDFLRRNPKCEYCASMGAERQSEVAVPRRIGDKEYFIALCWKHYQMLMEIESEG